ncbi:MAG TPA: malonate decarboxylase holo-[acyl-carrier-protein] synthase [Caldimonas sp.]|jgi:phosphoribosyl-dephospho-CoA transferase|nr:malonate decarboxylase holo-[acyl-carrier-protein] synthase [Caldimonas sp.]HEV7574914.1 malonate decarboxylase holo-[acyl-carrier-protein] synthase [Caldimonas sp.]
MDLRRHQLVRLTAAGWRLASTQHTDPAAQRCLAHWAANDLPLVVATQAVGVDGGNRVNRVDGVDGVDGVDAFDVGGVALGLPAPADWGRGRFALRVAVEHLRPGTAAFPLLAEYSDGLWNESQQGSSLRAALAGAAAETRVYGSFGWQWLTRLAYVRERSDLDLLLPAADAQQADSIVEALTTCGIDSPRLDGELSFVDGSAVAWREWATWRSGRVDTILVKRLRGARLETGAAWLEARVRATVEQLA